MILDTDPGIDDAMAILFALRRPGIRLEALTTVFGNTDIDTATTNALRCSSSPAGATYRSRAGQGGR